MTRRYMGFWDCKECGHERIEGLTRVCPQCRNHRHKYEVIRFPDPKVEITDPATLRMLETLGPDWYCEYCDAANPGNVSTCEVCGAEKGTSPERETFRYTAGAEPKTGAEAEVLAEKLRARDQQPASSQTGRSGEMLTHVWSTTASEPIVGDHVVSRPNTTRDYSGITTAASLLLVIICFLGLGLVGYLLLRPVEVEATISRFEWSRNIPIDQFRTVEESDWSIPRGGRQIAVRSEIHHYDQVFDHYDTEEYKCGSESYACGSSFVDDGNGTGHYETDYCSRDVMCSRQVPVYRDVPVRQPWYTYEIDKWVHSRDVPTSGTNRTDPAPYWGEFTLACEGVAQIGCERVGNRSETYTVYFVSAEGEEQPPYQETMGDWNAYDADATYTVVTNFTGIINDPLRPEE